jgi:hypothetical protein
VPRQLLWSAAAGLCVLVTTSAGFAQTAYYRPLSAVSATSPQGQSRYQYPAPATLVGTYHSSDFFPSPLTLTITGMDRYGNLSGSIAGMRSYQPKGEVDWAWETWQHNFGRDGSKASYRDGKVTIVFSNGATYTLDNRGNQLVGTFVAGNERSSMTFLKSQGLASGR